MQESGSEREREEINQFAMMGMEVNDSFNQTALTINLDPYEFDDTLAEDISPKLKDFCTKMLKHKGRHLKLENSEIFSQMPYSIFPPVPELYFLPYQILVRKEVKLKELSQELQKEFNLEECSYDPQKSEISIKVHTNKELTFYLIRKVIHPLEHKHMECLDEDLMVDKLYKFYAYSCRKIHFDYTFSCFVYWAYVKGLYPRHLSSSCIKLLIIFLYTSFGVGVGSVIQCYKAKNKALLQDIGRMSEVKKNGECQLKDKIKDYSNYTVKTINGFWISSKDRFMRIPKIYPICYPVDSSQFKEYACLVVKLDDSAKMKKENSIGKALYRTFKILDTLLNESVKVKIDLSAKKWLSKTPAEEISIQIIHPVLEHNIYQPPNDRSLFRLRDFVHKTFEGFQKKDSPMEVFKEMLTP